ncbi:MAG: FCD domain-containing protein [Geminicoccaceae bacterium]
MALAGETTGGGARVYAARGVHGRLVELFGRRILGEALPPGALLPREAELALQEGASRTAIREALKVLSAKGLVETRQKTGTRVRPRQFWNLLDPDVLAWQAAEGTSQALTAHLVELRRMIEPAAARLAAGRRSAAELAAIEAAARAMRASLGDPAAYYEADLAFHRAIFAACGNPLVDRLGAIVAAVLEVSFRLQQRSLLPFERGLALHERVLAAIAASDAAAADAAMLDIIEAARVELDRAADPAPKARQ